MEMIKTGIVVEGGAMRGIYGAGVLDVLLEKNIHADGLIGVSAGAIPVSYTHLVDIFPSSYGR